MKNPLVVIFVCCTLFLSAGKKPKDGIYRAVLAIDSAAQLEIPFNFEWQTVEKKAKMIIHNGDEKIVADEIRYRKDSVFVLLPVFDTEFRFKVGSTGLSGIWVNHYRTEKNKIPFKAVYGDRRRFTFEDEKTPPLFEGRWEVTFSPSKNKSNAIGVFHHQEQSNVVTGTFLTPTGDYRYLEGVQHSSRLYLSGFDGSHAYLFIAEISGDKLNGVFYSGKHWKEDWIGIRNQNFNLPEEAGPNFTEGCDESLPVSFTLTDVYGRTVSLGDEAYKGKPVILQVMGTWCSNCMDEGRYLTELSSKYKEQGLEIIALTFEKTTDLEQSRARAKRFVERLHIPYPVLVTGQTGNVKLSTVMKGLCETIHAFPTVYFLDREHFYRGSQRGFSGPATGDEYLKLKANTEEFIQKLIKN